MFNKVKFCSWLRIVMHTINLFAFDSFQHRPDDMESYVIDQLVESQEILEVCTLRYEHVRFNTVDSPLHLTLKAPKDETRNRVSEKSLHKGIKSIGAIYRAIKDRDVFGAAKLLTSVLVPSSASLSHCSSESSNGIGQGLARHAQKSASCSSTNESQDDISENSYSDVDIAESTVRRNDTDQEDDDPTPLGAHSIQYQEESIANILTSLDNFAERLSKSISATDVKIEQLSQHNALIRRRTRTTPFDVGVAAPLSSLVSSYLPNWVSDSIFDSRTKKKCMFIKRKQQMSMLVDRTAQLKQVSESRYG